MMIMMMVMMQGSMCIPKCFPVRKLVRVGEIKIMWGRHWPPTTRRTLITKGRRAVGLDLLCLQQNDLPLTQLIDWLELQMPLIIAVWSRSTFLYVHTCTIYNYRSGLFISNCHSSSESVHLVQATELGPSRHSNQLEGRMVTAMSANCNFVVKFLSSPNRKNCLDQIHSLARTLARSLRLSQWLFYWHHEG